MNPKVKIVLVVAVILALLTLSASGFYLYQKESVKNAELEDKLDELSTKVKITQAKFLESQKVMATLEEKLKDATAQIETLNSKLTVEQSAKEDALAKIEEMRVDLGMQKDLRSDLEKKLSQAQDDVKNIQSKLNVMQSEKMVLENKVAALEEKANVELGKIVVSPEAELVKAKEAKPAKKKAKEAPAKKKAEAPAVSSPAEPEAKVLVVNKEYNFAVISIGSKDGVAVGDVFSVYHGNKPIGELKVEKLQEAMAAAGFVNDDLVRRIQEGDKIVKKRK
jgi:chromosome segregation ATPase